MAEQEGLSLSSTFPNPPSFWNDFTTNRVARYEQLRKDYLERNRIYEHAADSVSFRIPNLPEDLATLQPPPEPEDGRWRVFGDQYMLDDKLPTLDEQGITNLPATRHSTAKDAKHFDRAFELKRLAKSLLLNFLELSGLLSRNPSHAGAKVQDLRTLFINIHHILNEYRPHQARESAIKMMEDHLDRTRAETLAIRTQIDKAKRVLEGLGSVGVADETSKQEGVERSVVKDLEALALERERDAWAAADKLFT